MTEKQIFVGRIMKNSFGKDKKGALIGFIDPVLPEVYKQIAYAKCLAKAKAEALENPLKDRCDGHIQFVRPETEVNRFYSEGNALGLMEDEFVTFTISYDGRGMPQAKNVQPAPEPEDFTVKAEQTLFKPKSVAPAQPTPAVDPDLAPAVSAGLAEMDEDEEDGIELDESLIDFEDEEDDYYDPDRIWGSSKRERKPKQKSKKKERYDD